MSAPASLGDFAAALGHAMEASLHASPPRPDFADALARARAIDEAAIPDGLLASVAEPEPDGIDALDDRDRPDPALASFAAALRDRVEEGVRERELAPVPAAPRPQSRRLIAAAAVLAVAAALLLGWGWSRLSPTVLDPNAAHEPMGAAGAQVEAHEDPREVHEPREPGTPALGPSPSPEADDTAGAQTEPEPTPAPARVATIPRERPSLDELEAQARERWAAGDLASADTLFRRVVSRTGKGNRAELAYGDLFAIAKQRGGLEALEKAWREYLRRFPRGRYADDARAGLCRRATADVAPSCWNEYLSAHPRGTHASEARRIVEASQSP